MASSEQNSLLLSGQKESNCSFDDFPPLSDLPDSRIIFLLITAKCQLTEVKFYGVKALHLWYIRGVRVPQIRKSCLHLGRNIIQDMYIRGASWETSHNSAYFISIRALLSGTFFFNLMLFLDKFLNLILFSIFSCIPGIVF